MPESSNGVSSVEQATPATESSATALISASEALGSSAVTPATSESRASNIESASDIVAPASSSAAASHSSGINSDIVASPSLAESASRSVESGHSPASSAPASVSPVVTSAPTSEPGSSATAVAPGSSSATKTTKNWLPSSLVMALSSSDDSSAETDSDHSKPTPSLSPGLPRAIAPELTSTPGENYDVITVGFKSALNYPFVVNNTITSAQIFEYLPGVLTYPFDDDKKFNDTVVKQLIPYQAANIDYTITVAEVYFPTNYIKKLGQYINNQNSALYKNPSGIENTLASLIDPRIPLTGLVDTSQLNSGSSSSGNGQTNKYGSMDASYSGQKITNKGRIAGITVGAAAGCGLYMSLMILLFRRFRKNIKNIELPPTDTESDYTVSSEGSSVTEGVTTTASTRNTTSSPFDFNYGGINIPPQEYPAPQFRVDDEDTAQYIQNPSYQPQYPPQVQHMDSRNNFVWP